MYFTLLLLVGPFRLDMSPHPLQYKLWLWGGDRKWGHTPVGARRLIKAILLRHIFLKKAGQAGFMMKCSSRIRSSENRVLGRVDREMKGNYGLRNAICHIYLLYNYPTYWNYYTYWSQLRLLTGNMGFSLRCSGELETCSKWKAAASFPGHC